MDVLTNKARKSYNYTSRYASFNYGLHTLDNKYIYEKTANLSTSTQYVLIPVDDMTTLNSLANKYYGRPDFFWIIADFNRIQDPFIKLSDYFTEIKIPSISAISYEE